MERSDREITLFGDFGKVPTMSSREIADLVESRHDKVRQSIERLADRGVIDVPPLGEDQIETSHGRKHLVQVYHLAKRDSFVVVAQLSPEFTARLVDRWQELEQQVAAPALPDFTDPGAAARAWAEQFEANKALTEESQRQAVQIDDMREDVEAHDRVVKSYGSMSITEASKFLGIKRKDLMIWMFENKWVYRSQGVGPMLGYEEKRKAGLLEHKVETKSVIGGRDILLKQTKVTTKGLGELAKIVPRDGQDTLRLV